MKIDILPVSSTLFELRLLNKPSVRSFNADKGVILSANESGISLLNNDGLLF